MGSSINRYLPESMGVLPMRGLKGAALNSGTRLKPAVEEVAFLVSPLQESSDVERGGFSPAHRRDADILVTRTKVLSLTPPKRAT